VQRLFAALPLTQRAARLANTSLLEVMMVSAVLHFRQAHLFNRGAARLARSHLRRQIADPELRRKLTPDYDFGCKRPTFSNTYYPTFNRPNVTLETASIERVEPDGIVTADGAKATIDTLILATGYNIWDTNFPAVEILGRGGRSLGKWWRENRFQAYEGVAIPQFPNLLSLASPYSYSGLSYFTTIESQMRHMKRLFGELHRRGATTFEVREDANAQFLDRVTDKLGDSVFYLGACSTARSYYFNQHGEAAILRPTSTINAFREADRFPLEDYAYA
jgi:cation diffusion facilitator CzcD-associated flavoprotein CzcO